MTWYYYKNNDEVVFSQELPIGVEQYITRDTMVPIPAQKDGYELKLMIDFQANQVWYDYSLTTQGLKNIVLENLEKYDASPAVNDFSIQGIHLWLDLNKRTGLKLRFEAEQAQGQEDTVLWHDGMQFPLKIQDALMMLFAIEVYASACYDNTQRHAAAISAITEKEELAAYDFTTGYPEKLEF